MNKFKLRLLIDDILSDEDLTFDNSSFDSELLDHIADNIMFNYDLYEEESIVKELLQSRYNYYSRIKSYNMDETLMRAPLKPSRILREKTTIPVARDWDKLLDMAKEMGMYVRDFERLHREYPDLDLADAIIEYRKSLGKRFKIKNK